MALVLAVLALVGATWWWSARNSDERRIRRQVDRLMHLAEKEPGEGALAALERARAITDIFASEFELRARPFGFHTRDRRALAAAIQSYRASSDRIWAEVSDSDLQVDPEAGRAILHLTARFGGGAFSFDGREAYRFQIDWVEENGEWRIAYADLLDVVR